MICDLQALLPPSLIIRLDYNVTGDPLYCGGLADVWKGQYRGRDVAVKGLTLRSKSDPGQIRRVSCRWCLALLCVIDNRPRLAEVLQGGYSLERPPSRERPTAVGRDNDRRSARDDIGVDGGG